MPSGVYKMTDIPENHVETEMGRFRLDAPLTVEKKKQPSGLWTVIATFPGEGEKVEVFSG